MTNYDGKDNYGRPKSAYLEKIAAMSDEQLQSECVSTIFMSARCSNNQHADWHWKVDACYDECAKREKPDIYKAAYGQIESDCA